MHLIGGELVLSATDLVDHVSCAHLTTLNLSASRGEIERPESFDESRQLLADLGDEHELAHLASLVAEGLGIERIERPRPTHHGLTEAQDRTIDAMRAGVDVVFQATFFDGRFRGHADFLRRVEKASHLGGWSYEPYDAKLARSVKVTAVVQLAQYAAQLAVLQGREPDAVHVILGDDTVQTLPLGEIAPYHRQTRRRLERALDNPAPTAPDPVSHCAVCAWAPRCNAEREAGDHLSLVAGVRRDHVSQLLDVGISTAAGLAAATSGQRPLRLAEATFDRIRRQARLQVAARHGDESVEVLDPATNPRGGFRLLGAPTEHDLYFDLEGDPHRGEGGLEYLWGITDAHDHYRCWWAHDPAAERRAFEAVVDFFIAHLDAHPEMRIHHYANYEVAVLRRLASRHASREAEVDRLLRQEVMVDLYAIARQAIQTSQPSMSIKALEQFYREARNTEVVGGLQSVVAYERWLESRDPATLEDIRLYNLDDCVSTRQLHVWLEDRRAEAETRWGPIGRPDAKPAEMSPGLLERRAAVAELIEELLAGVPDDGSDRDEDQQVRWLLAQLADWHRRETKPGYWWHFSRLEMSDEQLWLDRESISGLEYIGEVGAVKQSLLHAYRFDADQPYKMAPGASPIDPDTRAGCGTIESLDPIEGVVVLRRSATSAAPHPSHLIPGRPVNTAPLADAVFAVGRATVEDSLEPEKRFGAIDALLRRAPPRFVGDAPMQLPDETAADAVVRLGPRLDHSVLAVQGPPGSGKTTVAARMVKAAIDAGLRVGITSNSHAVIVNLLRKIGEICPGAVLLKAGGADPLISGCRHVGGGREATEEWSSGDAQVVGGTVWLFSRPEMRGAIDLLVVDEAGQVSLANAVAAATSAERIVAFGDPQQLDQPIQGVHPSGLDASMLGHILSPHVTVPADLGIFLDRTHRLHPEICSFISGLAYEGRLESAPACTTRAIEGVGRRLVLEEVAHHGNSTRSLEEVERVGEVIGGLVGRTLTESDGSTRSLTGADILVIAPYNAQVRELAHALSREIEVGTVDRFQGRQAAVVIYSMAASSGEDTSRGVDFLFSINRFNVAISRAQTLVVVVASPALLDTPCTNARQVRLVSALCRFGELADRSSHSMRSTLPLSPLPVSAPL